MQYIIAVFKSRNETLYFANMLKSNGFFVSIVNTPKEAGQTCGISVKFEERLLAIAKEFLSSKPFRSFYGFFKVKEMGVNRRIIEKLGF